MKYHILQYVSARTHPHTLFIFDSFLNSVFDYMLLVLKYLVLNADIKMLVFADIKMLVLT